MHRVLLLVSLLAWGGAPTSALSAPDRKATPKVRGKVNAQAQPKAKSPSKAQPAKKPDELVPVDDLKTRLFAGNKTRNAEVLGKAWSALDNQKYSEARRLALRMRNDSTIGDYGTYVLLHAYRSEAESLLDKKPAEARELIRKAIPLAAGILEKQPYSALMPALQQEQALTELVLADAQYALKNPMTAQGLYESAFQRMHRWGAVSKIRPLSLGNYARTCKKKSSAFCDAWLKKFSRIYAKKSAEMRTLAEVSPGVLDKAKASYGYRRLTASYGAPDPDFEKLQEGLDAYIKADYRDARDAFEEFLEKFPRSTHRFRARYWLAQAHTKIGDNEKSKKIFEEVMKESPLTYYGLLSSLALGKPLAEYMSATLPSARAIDPLLDPWEIARVKRAEQLIASGAHEAAYVELTDFKPRSNHSNEFLTYLALLNHEAKNHRAAFVVLGELIQRGSSDVFSSFGLDLIFPKTYYTDVEKAAQARGLDPVLVLSLIKQESAFDARAVSHAGANGLMQLMPSTAVDVDGEVHRANLTHVDTNIRIGTTYLKKLVDRFSGNLVFALAGYNAGPTAVSRWIKQGKAKNGMLEFIEQIPYKETREYVGSIIRNYYWYAPRLKGETPKGLDFFWPVSEPDPKATPLPEENVAPEPAESPEPRESKDNPDPVDPPPGMDAGVPVP